MEKSKKTPRVWQRMLSGRRLNLYEPSPLDIELTDIALGLSRVARWNGQTNQENIFSVAQHSLLVHYIFKELYPKSSRTDQLYALLHDAPEYVIGDMISPFKALIGDTYKEIEEKLAAAIHQRFSLPPTISVVVKKQIKKADIIAAYLEATQLAGFTETEARKYFCATPSNPTPTHLLTCMDCQSSYQQFIEAVNKLLS